MRITPIMICAALLAGCATSQPVAPVATPGAPVAKVDWSTAQTVEIHLKNFAFDPMSLALRRGVPYRLRFVNLAKGGHDFSAKEFFAEATIDPQDQATLKDGAVELGGGQSADVRLVANQTGRYPSHCTHFMHSSLGMNGEVIVQ